MNTAYITHPDCLRHEMGAGHPECPERLLAIQEELGVSGLLVLALKRGWRAHLQTGALRKSMDRGWF